MQPIIKLENLSVVYDAGKTSESWALKDINLEIYPQEYVMFFGPSGCGKSTLLYTIAGLEKPTAGSVVVNDNDLTLFSDQQLIKFHQSTIGMIFQAFYLIPSLSAMDNILLPQMFIGSSLAERKKRCYDLMEKFGILNFSKRRPPMLSGGQQQRVAIARALINDPDIVLIDEPVGNLDSKNAEIVLNLISDLNRDFKKTMIHVTHDPRQLSFADRIFYIKDGMVTKVVSNANKKKGIAQVSASELEKLAQLYPYLSESRLRAKFILNNLLTPYSIDDQQKMEELIDKYLNKKINEEQMIRAFDGPRDADGISLYKQTAHHLVEQIVSIVKEKSILDGIEIVENTLSPFEEKARMMRQFLLDDYKKILSLNQISRIENFLVKRVKGEIDKKQLEKYFDMPFNKDGVGLNSRTAKNFVDKIELILMGD